MYISELRIRNFRNFRCARFSFSKGVNTLIGENGSGKTNALYCLRLLLDESLSRNATRLVDTDFCRALEHWRGQWIVISIDFDELDPSEGCQLLRHAAGHMDETETGTFTMCFRPNLETRIKLHEMSCDEESSDAIRAFLETITTDEYESIFFGRGAADFLDDSVYEEFVGDLETFKSHPNPNDDDQEKIGVRIGAIHPEISCTFAPALRDVVADLRGYRSNPLLGLLRGTEADIQVEDGERLVQAVADLNSNISSLPEIKTIAEGIQNTLQSTVGQTYSPAVTVESALPDQLDRLLQKLSVRVGDDLKSDYRGELSEQGLGGANLIYLALKLLEYEVKLSSDRVAHYLLIEEPEAHIHTHVQKTLFEHQASKRTQVIVSTHSTHISSAAKITSCNVLAKCDDFADVFQPANGLSLKQSKRVERYLDAVRSTLLFAKGVLLVEGEAELILIPAMVKAVFGLSPDQMGISVIAMNSAFFRNIAVIFHDERIRRHCAIITDLDKSFTELADNPKEDDSFQRHARASEKSGARRKTTLDDFCDGNEWVQTFFADHTFEVEFLSIGNSVEVVRTLSSIYSDDKFIRKSKARLNSDDPDVAFREVLRLASKVGKGWFSLLIAEALDVYSVFPHYVLQALVFAANGLTPNVIKQMGLFRVSKMKDLPDEIGDIELLTAMPPMEFIKHYTETLPKDELSELVSYWRDQEFR